MRSFCAVVNSVLVVLVGILANEAVRRGRVASFYDFVSALPVFPQIWKPLKALKVELGVDFEAPPPDSLEQRPSDVWVITWPKSGTTWVSHMAHQLRMHGQPPNFQDQDDVVPWAEMLETDYLQGTVFHRNPNADHLAHPRIFKSHLPLNRLPAGEFKKVIVLREPGDALISAAKFLPTLWGIGEPTPSVAQMCSFLLYNGDLEGMLNFFVEAWHARLQTNVLLLFYEDLQEDPARGVRELAQFMEIDADPALIALVTQQTSHAAMTSLHFAFANRAQSANAHRAQGLTFRPEKLVGKVRRDGGRVGDRESLPQSFRETFASQWKRCVAAKLGFENFGVMREAARQEFIARSRQPPLVDMSGLFVPSDEARFQATAAKVAEAAQTWGTLRLTNHGLHIDAIRRAAREYFSLPYVQRNISVRNKSTGFQRGAIPFAGEGGVSNVLEVKEGFLYGFEWPQDTEPIGHGRGRNVWPADSHFRGKQILQDYYKNAVEIARLLVHAVELQMGSASSNSSDIPEAEDRMKAICNGGEEVSLMRLFNYFGSSYHPETAVGLPRTGSAPHTDWYLITLIMRDDASRLQVLPRNETAWIDVPGKAEDGELVALFGDYLSLHTIGRTHSPVHRVLLPLAAESSLSSVFLFSPSFEALMPLHDPNSSSLQIPGTDCFNTLLDQADDTVWGRPFGDYIQRKRGGVMRSVGSK